MRRALLLLAVNALACSAAPPRASSKPAAPAVAEAAGPARWLFTDRLGVLFDEAGRGSALPRREPAIIDGVRVVVDGGVIVASSRHAERLLGFRSLPERLGGGYVLWSDDRVYRAAAFLDDPRPIADVGVHGGARPWLGSVLLRTRSGLLELDPNSLALRRAAWPGVADALALDGQRAIRVDTLGRASITVDGGKSFVDLLATRGARVTGLRHELDGEIMLLGPTSEALHFGARGDVHTARQHETATPFPEARTAVPLLDAALPASSRALPGEIAAHAIAWGAPLPGGRVLVTRENGARVLSLETGLPVADADLPAIDERFARCQAASIGSPPQPSLVCSTPAGAHVITIDGSFAKLSLDATFAGQDGGFFGGPRGRLAFDGACGPAEPRPTDLGPGTPRANGDPMDEGTPGNPPARAPEGGEEPPADDDARVCLRAASARWIERRLRGEDARRLYRWVPGDDGAITALILTGKDEAGDGDEDRPAAKKREAAPSANDAPPSPPEGVRVIRVDADDPALRGGAFPAVPAPQRDAPYRAIDPTFWQDDDGAIRGWIRLPVEGEEKVLAPASPQGAAKRMLQVASGRGGRSAGVRIDAAGRVTVLALPDGVTEVVTGGPFALAMAQKEGATTWFETTDGGARWTPIEGPPVGALEPPIEEVAPFACSSLGCAFGNGIVRLGWGGPSPSAPKKEPALAPAVNPKLREPSLPPLRCRLDAEPPWPRADAKPPPPKMPPKSAAPAPKPAASKPKPAPPKTPPKPAATKPKKPGKSAPPAAAPKPATPHASSGPISLRHASSAIGELREPAWSGDVMPPLQPLAALRHLSASDRTLRNNTGKVVPVLSDQRDPLDLLLVFDHHRVRATGAAKVLPFAPGARFTIGADLPGGVLALFDAEHAELYLARGAAVASVLQIARPPDVVRTRLTLARKLGAGIALVGYSTTSGEVFLAELDLGRAEAGPPVALASLSTLAVCADAKPAARFLADLTLTVRVTGRGGEALFDQPVTAAVLIGASADRLCVEGIETALPKGEATVLSATMGKGAVASVRSGAKMARATCTLER